MKQGMTPMKSNKSKKAKKPTLKIDMHTWNTSDADEIARRKVRAELETFQVDNLNPNERYFSTYHVSNTKDKQYCVEIRSLTSIENSCDCPDYRSNRLGTCKHIEHVLFRLRKKGVRAFKQAAREGSPYVEIFLNPKETSKNHFPRRCSIGQTNNGYREISFTTLSTRRGTTFSFYRESFIS